MQRHFQHTPTVRNCRSFGCVLFWTRFIWQQYTVRHYHSDLSDQSALG